jgi:hypothetical protein
MIDTAASDSMAVRFAAIILTQGYSGPPPVVQHTSVVGMHLPLRPQFADWHASEVMHASSFAFVGSQVLDV